MTKNTAMPQAKSLALSINQFRSRSSRKNRYGGSLDGYCGDSYGFVPMTVIVNARARGLDIDFAIRVFDALHLGLKALANYLLGVTKVMIVWGPMWLVLAVAGMFFVIALWGRATALKCPYCLGDVIAERRGAPRPKPTVSDMDLESRWEVPLACSRDRRAWRVILPKCKGKVIATVELGLVKHYCPDCGIRLKA